MADFFMFQSVISEIGQLLINMWPSLLVLPILYVFIYWVYIYVPYLVCIVFFSAAEK